MSRGKRFRKDGWVQRSLCLEPSLDAYMKSRKDINWSVVIENYLKVYVRDLQNGVPRQQGEPKP